MAKKSTDWIDTLKTAKALCEALGNILGEAADLVRAAPPRYGQGLLDYASGAIDRRREAVLQILARLRAVDKVLKTEVSNRLNTLSIELEHELGFRKGPGRHRGMDDREVRAALLLRNPIAEGAKPKSWAHTLRILNAEREKEGRAPLKDSTLRTHLGRLTVPFSKPSPFAKTPEPRSRIARKPVR